MVCRFDVRVKKNPGYAEKAVETLTARDFWDYMRLDCMRNGEKISLTK
jgi:hypothetical protein